MLIDLFMLNFNLEMELKIMVVFIDGRVCYYCDGFRKGSYINVTFVVIVDGKNYCWIWGPLCNRADGGWPGDWRVKDLLFQDIQVVSLPAKPKSETQNQGIS
jgi:hypothetical protein